MCFYVLFYVFVICHYMCEESGGAQAAAFVTCHYMCEESGGAQAAAGGVLSNFVKAEKAWCSMHALCFM